MTLKVMIELGLENRNTYQVKEKRRKKVCLLSCKAMLTKTKYSCGRASVWLMFPLQWCICDALPLICHSKRTPASFPRRVKRWRFLTGELFFTSVHPSLPFNSFSVPRFPPICAKSVVSSPPLETAKRWAASQRANRLWRALSCNRRSKHALLGEIRSFICELCCLMQKQSVCEMPVASPHQKRCVGGLPSAAAFKYRRQALWGFEKARLGVYSN